MLVKKIFFLVSTLTIFLSGCSNSLGVLFENRDDMPEITTENYKSIESPIFNYASGEYSHDIEIEITSPTEGAVIFYSTDGSARDEDLIKYSSRIPLIGDGSNTTIKAKSFFNGEFSEESIVSYSIDYGQVSTPQFKVVGKPFTHELGGFYPHDIQIEIICTTPDAEIYYTIDGSVPDTNSSKFSYPIYINGLTGTLTISAFAMKKDMDNSNTETATFTVEYLTTEPPIFDPPGGEYIKPLLVNMYSETEGATIIYTTDGTDPMTSSTFKYGNSVIVDTSMKIRAYAMKSGMWSSEERQADYKISE